MKERAQTSTKNPKVTKIREMKEYRKLKDWVASQKRVFNVVSLTIKSLVKSWWFKRKIFTYAFHGCKGGPGR